ncbi:MAG: hypothetical protein RIS88_3061 [Pseudomonadota bacterium]|jgi:hypothetical protein
MKIISLVLAVAGLMAAIPVSAQSWENLAVTCLRFDAGDEDPQPDVCPLLARWRR